MRVHARNDDGQVLGLALAFLIFVALVLAATLTAATTQLHATESLKQQRDERYAADAAVLAVTTRMQNDVNAGADRGASSQPCVFPVDFAIDPMHATVTCQPCTGSGVGDGNPDPSHAAPNRPSYSILALPADSSEGVVKVGSGDVNVYGPVHSNSPVCELPNCDNTSPVEDPAAADPDGYAPLLAAPPAAQPLPPCNNGQATFSQGTYSEIPDGGCPNMVFQPGVYYFDFTSPGSHIWKIPDGQTVVGGTPGQGMAPCKTEHDLPPNDGVQFVFGGDSVLQVAGGASVHLCAQPSTTRQQIAVYGVSTNPSGTTDQELTQSPTDGANGAFATQYDSPEAAAGIDGTEAHAAVPAAVAPVDGKASLDLTGFTALPEGSIVESARLTVKHHEDPAMQSLSLQLLDGSTPLLQPSFDSAAPCDPLDTRHLCISADPNHTDSLDVTAAFLDPRNSFINSTGLSNFGLRFTASAPGAGGPYDSFVDGVELDLTLAPAAPGTYRALTGCAHPAPEAGVPGCPLVSTLDGAALQLDGTAYAPTGSIDVGNTANGVGFNRGIVARSVVLHAGDTASVVTVGGGFDRWVILTVAVNGTQVTTSVIFSDAVASLDDSRPRVTYKTWSVE